MRQRNHEEHPEIFGKYKDSSAAKRWRKSQSRVDGLSLIQETLKAQLFMDVRQTTISF